MSLITAPAFAFREIEWELDQPAQVNRSQWTGKRTVVTSPWHGIWRSTIYPRTEQGEANFRALRGFFVNLQGPVNTFLLPATEAAQGVADTTVASGGAQGSLTLVMAASRTVTTGMLATVTLPSGNFQMVMITVDSTGTTLTFKPALRESAAVGAAVALSSPVCQVAMADSKFRWSVGSWRRYSTNGIAVEEAF
jgi:hypothetical protein